MSVAGQIEKALREAFTPEVLEIVDQSHLHKGHAGAPEGGESHFRVRMVSERFAGQSRVERQRAVQAVLKPQFDEGLHAISLTLSTPAEAAA